MDDLDRMLSGGAKGAKFEKPGDTITGIVDEVLVRQATEYGTGKPQTFDNGDPREQIMVVIRAEGVIREDDNDDQRRAVYIKGWGQQLQAFRQAVRDNGKPVQGSRFTATFTRLEPSKTGGWPAKVFEYHVQQLDTWDESGVAATFTRLEPSKTGGWPAKVFDHVQQLDTWDESGVGIPALVQDARTQALKLWDMNFTVEQIVAATGLDADEVNAITSDKPF